MKILQKQPVALLIMVVVIVLSCLLGCRRSLLALRQDVEDCFYNGEEGDGFSIQADLEYVGGTASNLKTVALRYISADDPAVVRLTEARNALTAAKDIPGKYAAATELSDAVQVLYDSLDPSKMTSTDKNYRASLYDDISSAMQRISHNEYNDRAREFNAILDGFPANLIVRIVHIDPIQLYG
ncbi:MAG: LemA family protein [Clostridia bacterium]|nr:LemA family protein [Clostridia bacterium]